MQTDETFLILGGGGMIGGQVVRQIARNLSPRRIIVASLYPREVQAALEQFKAEYPAVGFIGFAGDVFWRAAWNQAQDGERLSRAKLLESAEKRAGLYEDLFGDLDQAYAGSQLAQLIRDYKPDVIVDSIRWSCC
jgi:hypothetical protein